MHSINTNSDLKSFQYFCFINIIFTSYEYWQFFSVMVLRWDEIYANDPKGNPILPTTLNIYKQT